MLLFSSVQSPFRRTFSNWSMKRKIGLDWKEATWRFLVVKVNSIISVAQVQIRNRETYFLPKTLQKKTSSFLVANFLVFFCFKNLMGLLCVAFWFFHTCLYFSFSFIRIWNETSFWLQMGNYVWSNWAKTVPSACFHDIIRFDSYFFSEPIIFNYVHLIDRNFGSSILVLMLAVNLAPSILVLIRLRAP